MNSQIRIALFLSVAVLTQQAFAATPSTDSAQAQVTVPLTLDNVELSKIDGQTTQSHDAASLAPGAHTLTVTVEQEGRGSADQNCTLDFPYSAFKAGHQYEVDEHTAGPNVVANLKNSMGLTVSRAADMDCMDI